MGVEERVTRNLLEKICADELRRLRMPVELCFEQAGMELEPIRQANERREREKSRNKKQKRKQKKGARARALALACLFGSSRRFAHRRDMSR